MRNADDGVKGDALDPCAIRDLENTEESAHDDFHVQCGMFGGLGDTLQWRVWYVIGSHVWSSGARSERGPGCDLMLSSPESYTKLPCPPSASSVSIGNHRSYIHTGST